jgi:hypothetical protein
LSDHVSEAWVTKPSFCCDHPQPPNAVKCRDTSVRDTLVRDPSSKEGNVQLLLFGDTPVGNKRHLFDMVQIA